MRARTAIWVLCGLALGTLGVRIAEHARMPPFERGLPGSTPPLVGLEGLTTRLVCGSGEIELQAEHALSGHEDVLYFRLGPSTFVDLRHAVAVFREGGEIVWIVRGQRARLSRHTIEFTDFPVRERVGERPQLVRSLTIDLESGRVESE